MSWLARLRVQLRALVPSLLGELCSPLASSPFSQNDMCLVFVAFATWAVRTSDLHTPDAWKTGEGLWEQGEQAPGSQREGLPCSASPGRQGRRCAMEVQVSSNSASPLLTRFHPVALSPWPCPPFED